MDTVLTTPLLRDLLTSTRTPFYVYNKGVLEHTISEIRDAFQTQDFQLLFATMANDNEEFLRTVQQLGVGACVNSITHLKRVLDCGFLHSDIHFTSTGIPLEEMRLLAQHRITVNVDSIRQLEQWLSLNQGGWAGNRINTSSVLNNGAVASDRLGISKNDLPQAIAAATAAGGVINGLHIYVGTDYKDHRKMLEPITQLFQLAAGMPTLEYINIGGGIGVQYLDESLTFDLKAFGAKIISLRAALEDRLSKDVRLIFEPGRRIAASSGIFVTKVTDIKDLEDTRYIVVDASIAVFPRPLLHPQSFHKVTSPFKTGTGKSVTIVGKTTFSKDILAKTTLPEDIDVGDVLTFEQAGAYCDSMRSRFLGQYEPQSLFV